MRRFVAAFFRHPFILIVPALLIPLIVVFAVRTFASSYTSSAIVYITNNPFVTIPGTNIYDSPADNLKNNIAEYMNRPSFLLAVANRTDMPKTYPAGAAGVDSSMEQRVAAGLTITALGSETLSVQYSDSKPQIVPQVIIALLQEYHDQAIQDARNNASSTIAIAQQQLQTDEAQLNSDDAAVNQYIQQHPNADPSTDGHLALLESKYQNDLAQVQQDQQALEKINSQAGILENLPNFEITDPPRIPTAPTVKSKTTLYAMLGGVALGLGVSLGLTGLLTLFDQRIHSRDDLLEALPLPVLEVVPRLHGLQEEALVVGSEETLAHLSQVPILATLPSFTERRGTHDVNPVLTARAEEDE